MNYEFVQNTGTRIAAIAVDPPAKAAILARELELPFPLLCDVDRQVVRAFDLLNDEKRGGVAFPAVFVINPAGEVVYVSIDEKTKRADILEIITFLQTLHADPAHRQQGQRKKWQFPSIKQYLRNKGLLPDPYRKAD